MLFKQLIYLKTIQHARKKMWHNPREIEIYDIARDILRDLLHFHTITYDIFMVHALKCAENGF